MTFICQLSTTVCGTFDCGIAFLIRSIIYLAHINVIRLITVSLFRLCYVQKGIVVSIQPIPDFIVYTPLSS